jgi:hypothetical protein
VDLSQLTVCIAERGKLVTSPLYTANPTVRQDDGVASARRLTKRMSSCNGKDTELSPARKGAEFWRVLCREKIKGTFLKEESQMTAIRLVHLLLFGKGR